MTRRSSQTWTPDELVVVVADFPSGGGKACAAQLPGRSVAAIRKKAERLKVCTVFHVKQRLVPGKLRHPLMAERAVLRLLQSPQTPLSAAEWVARARAEQAKGNWAKSAAWMAAAAACEEGSSLCPFDPASEPVLHDAWTWWYPRATQVLRDRQARAQHFKHQADKKRRALAARSPALAEQMGIEVETHEVPEQPDATHHMVQP